MKKQKFIIETRSIFNKTSRNVKHNLTSNIYILVQKWSLPCHHFISFHFSLSFNRWVCVCVVMSNRLHLWLFRYENWCNSRNSKEVMKMCIKHECIHYVPINKCIYIKEIVSGYHFHHHSLLLRREIVKKGFTLRNMFWNGKNWKWQHKDNIQRWVCLWNSSYELYEWMNQMKRWRVRATIVVENVSQTQRK